MGEQERLGQGFAESCDDCQPLSQESWWGFNPSEVLGAGLPRAVCNAAASAGLQDGFLGNLDYHSAFIVLFEAFIDLFIFMAGDFCCIVSVGLYCRFRW